MLYNYITLQFPKKHKIVVISYRGFGTTYGSRNVGKKLPLLAV